jgi:hypothetical protein
LISPKPLIKYRISAFLDSHFGINYFLLLKSFLLNRHFVVRFGSAQHPLSSIHAGVPQGCVLEQFLYLIYSADLPTSPATTTATFADNTAILASDSYPATASLKLHNHLNQIQTWLHKWRMQANALKSVHVTFTTRPGMCPPVHMNNEQLPCADQVKYLGLHLDRKLTWHHHNFTKRKQLGLTHTKMYWLLGRSSRLSLPNKLLLYKSIHKPIWTYGIQLWGTASTSNIEILESFLSRALRIIVDAPRYVPNNHIRRDLQMPSVKEEICRYSNQYSTRLTTHPNDQILTLMEILGNRRLRRHVPNHLPNRFLL